MFRSGVLGRTFVLYNTPKCPKEEIIPPIVAYITFGASLTKGKGSPKLELSKTQAKGEPNEYGRFYH
jgi:hypothetical protein